MPVNVETRPRVYHSLVLQNHTPQHGHHVEYSVELCFVAANSMFLAGSALFLSAETTVLGAELFLIGSIIFVILSWVNMREQRAYDDFSFTEMSEKLVLGAHLLPESVDANPLQRIGSVERVLENVCYMFGSLCFALGSSLYIHRFMRIKEDEEWGSWLFVVGSISFVLATFFNGLGMTAAYLDPSLPPSIAVTAYHLAATGLCCTQLASVFFCVGSFLYRPGLDTECNERDDNVCVSASLEGTWLYILGSLLYLAQSCLNIVSARLKHRAQASAQLGQFASDEDDDESGDGGGGGDDAAVRRRLV